MATIFRERKMRHSVHTILVVLTLAHLVGCATTEAPTTQVTPQKIVFPPPPNQAVIEWVAEYQIIEGTEEKGERLRRRLVGERKRIDALGAPTEVALSPNDEIFIVDQTTGGSIAIIDRKTGFGLRWSGDGAGNLRNPIGVAIAADGTFYVSDSEAAAVYRYGPDRSFAGAFGGEGFFARPTAVAVSAAGDKLAVCDTGSHQVMILDAATGKLEFTLGEPGSSPLEGDFHYPVSVAFDDDGYIYVADLFNFRIQIFDPEGELDSTFGEAGTRVGDLYRPRGITVDSEAEVIYVTDSMMNVIQMFNFDGEMLMFFAAPGKGPAALNQASGITRRGDLLAVADTLNSRVQIFRFLGVPDQAD
jgi:DNA-binding beta-propeller fold protein YncE